MKVNLTDNILNSEGTVFKTPNTFGDMVNMTIGKAIGQALLNHLPGDESLSGEDKAMNYTIWYDKIKDQKQADFTPEEIVNIKKRVGIGFPALVVGQIYAKFKEK